MAAFNNSTQDLGATEEYDLILVPLFCGGIFLSILSIVFGLVTWIFVPKWRQFRHHVFLCLLLTFPLPWILSPISDTWPSSQLLVTMYVMMAFGNWLVIITVMFFIEFVQIFTTVNKIRNYLLSNMFGWILPLVTETLYVLYGEGVVAIMFITQLLVNVILYIRVLFALCKPSRVPEPEGGKSCGTKIILSTFTFIATGIFLFIPFFIMSVYDSVFFMLFFMITMYSINIFFLMLKSHRELWAERWRRVMNSRI